MSKDMLGAVVRAAVSVPQDRLEVLAKVASAMAAENPTGDAWCEQLKKLLKERIASAGFKRNERGHIVFMITGLALTGEQEIKRLEKGGCRVGGYAKQCLMSTKPNEYDAKHRLVSGKKYKIVLVPGKEISKNSDRTTANLQKLGEKFGYGKPLAGIVPRIREMISDEQIEKMGFCYIAGLHDPIAGAGGSPHVLDAIRDDDGQWLDGYWGNPDDHWNDDGAFAFVLPAS